MTPREERAWAVVVDGVIQIDFIRIESEEAVTALEEHCELECLNVPHYSMRRVRIVPEEG
jgi:hypothetical protein